MINIAQILISDAIGLAMMLIIKLHVRRNTPRVLISERLFGRMVDLTATLCVLETLSFLLDGMQFPGAIALNHLINALVVALPNIFTYLWVLYADFKVYASPAHTARRALPLAIPALVIMALAMTNAMTGVFFTISPQNVYQRSPMAILVYLTAYAYLIAGAVIVYANRGKQRQYLFVPVGTFIVPIVLGSVIQFLNYGLATLWAGVALGMIALYINTQSESMYVDRLSGLYNRLYLDRFLDNECGSKGKNRRLAGLMLDIDGFKEINDVHGHLTGDGAIRAAGEILRRSVDHRRAFVARYGGDEFVIMARLSEGEDAQGLIDEVCAQTEAFNQAQTAPYTIAFSIGMTDFSPDCESKEDFLHRMDQRMYAMKRKSREQRTKAI